MSIEECSDRCTWFYCQCCENVDTCHVCKISIDQQGSTVHCPMRLSSRTDFHIDMEIYQTQLWNKQKSLQANHKNRLLPSKFARKH